MLDPAYVEAVRPAVNLIGLAVLVLGGVIAAEL